MKLLSKKELEQKARAVFKTNKVDALFATSDGQFFIDQNRAELHSKSNDKLKVYNIDAEPANDDDYKEEYTVKDIEQMVKDIEDIEKLEAMIEKESKGKNRVTAIEAINERIEELNEKNENQ